MQVSDMALLKDPEFGKWMQYYAKNEQALKKDFGIAYKVATELGWKKPKNPDTNILTKVSPLSVNFTLDAFNRYD